jgi:hypothetical protein
MDTKDIGILAIIFCVVCVPVLGLTARLALKPIVDAIVRLRESSGTVQLTDAVAGRMMELENEVRHLRAGVARLEETVDFQQKLLSSPAAAALSAAPGDR